MSWFSAPLLFFGALALSLGSLSSTSYAQAQPRVVLQGGDASEVAISEQGGVTHKAANFPFPPQVGDMPLRKVIIYGKADLSVDYTLRGGGNGDAWITFYIYPVAGHPFENEAQDVEDSLTGKWSATRIAPVAAAPASAADGRSGWFRGTFNGLHATTGYILVQRANWFVEARYTIPDAAGQSGIDRTVRALAALPWDWKPAEASTSATTGRSVAAAK